NHRGFAIIDVIQPCPTFYDVRREIRGRLYKLEGHDPADFKAALNLALEAEKIPLGVLYDVEKPAFEENFKHLVKQPAELASLRKLTLAKLLARFS
ncbi:MAG: 2-oxoacid:ferredoxin oxidoreductase subunit beta, partial [Thermofilum sp.]